MRTVEEDKRWEVFTALGEVMPDAITNNRFRVLDFFREWMKTRRSGTGYVRIVTKGKFELCDYNAGLYSVKLCVQVNTYVTYTTYNAWLLIGNLDDGEFTAQSKEFNTREEAQALVDEVALVLDDWTVMPSLNELNEQLLKFGMSGQIS